jgi:hypothetical protein
MRALDAARVHLRLARVLLSAGVERAAAACAVLARPSGGASATPHHGLDGNSPAADRIRDAPAGVREAARSAARHDRLRRR